jgi:hypothetical protein
MSSPIKTTPMFIDGTHVEASPLGPRTCACYQQGVDDKPISKKCRRNFGGVSNIVATLSNLAESSNKIEILKLEAQKIIIEQTDELAKKFSDAQAQIATLFANALKPRATREED